MLISLIVMILITLLTTVFLEVIWNSSKNVQGIEASNAAYYQALGIIEEQLIDPEVTKQAPWNIKPASEANPSGTGRFLTVSTGGTSVPVVNQWNSPYDDDYNIISLGEPVQIVIPGGVDWNNVNFEFRVPKVSSDSGTWVVATMSNSWVILWTLGYTGASLYASGETQIFRWSDINILNNNNFSSFSGITNTGSALSVSDFYSNLSYLWTSGAKCNPYNCTLKLSMIRSVMTSATPGGTHDWRTLPFLEYRINFDVSGPSSIRVPSQFMTLDASAYAYGFQRTTRVRIPQITTNTALDFAVLQ